MKLQIVESESARAEAANAAGEPVVLAFDSGDLRTSPGLSIAAGRIYRRRRRGQPVDAQVGSTGAEPLLSEIVDALRSTCDTIGLQVGGTAGDLAETGLVVRQGSERPTAALEGLGAERPLRVAIAGYGVVGQSLAARLQVEPLFSIVGILVRDAARLRAVPPPAPVTDDQQAFLDVEADAIVDVLSCAETGGLLCGAAIPRGTHVVSASKRVISAGLAALSEAAGKSGALLHYSAAVGGAAPVLETVARARAAGPVRSFAGILNGTVNYILDRLHEGLSFDEALLQAQRAGFAEANSDYDLSGADAAAKLRLVAHAAFGIDPQAVEVSAEPLDDAAVARIAASGARWVQAARLERSGGAVSARIELRPQSEVSELPEARDEWNAAAVTLEDGRVFRCIGRGAGGAPTAEAIVADLYDVVDALAARRPLDRVAC